MASTNCWRCLLRPSTALPIRTKPPSFAVPSAAFSTTVPVAGRGMVRKKNKGGGGPSTHKPKAKVHSYLPFGHLRHGKHKQINRNKRLEKPPRIATGERKAFRKRIQLSNNNALQVPGLEMLSSAVMADPANVARMYAVPDAVVDQLRAVEAFKATQSWGFFRQPSVLVRAETVELAKKILEAGDKKETLRLVIDGDRIAGKSILLLQALAAGFMNDWIVINIPEGQELTEAGTEYAKLPDTEPAQYSQPVYVMRLLGNMLKASAPLLDRLATTKEYPQLPVEVPVGSSLSDLINVAKEAEHAWAVFTALWAELTDPAVPRPPILFALDGLSHIMQISAYRSPAFELIHAHDLALVRLFVDVLSGKATLPHGGAALAATTKGNTRKLASLDLALAQRLAEQERLEEVPRADPFCRTYDARVDAALRSVQVLRLRGVDKTEARALMEYWAASGVLRSRVTGETVADRWSVGGGGIVGEMERASLLTMRDL